MPRHVISSKKTYLYKFKSLWKLRRPSPGFYFFFKWGVVIVNKGAFDLRATHTNAHALQTALLVTLPYGCLLLRVRVRNKEAGAIRQRIEMRRMAAPQRSPFF